MNKQIWTTQQLIRFSSSMASAFGSGLNPVATEPVATEHEEDKWTTEKLVNMSQSLARAYYTGL